MGAREPWGHGVVLQKEIANAIVLQEEIANAIVLYLLVTPSTSLYLPSIIHKNVRLHVCCRFAAQYGLFRPAAWPFRAFVSARAVWALGPALQAGAPSLAFFTTNPFSAPCRGHCQGRVCLAAAMTQQVRPPRNCPRQAHLLRIASACLSLQGVRRAGRRHWCRRLPSRMQTGRR